MTYDRIYRLEALADRVAGNVSLEDRAYNLIHRFMDLSAWNVFHYRLADNYEARREEMSEYSGH